VDENHKPETKVVKWVEPKELLQLLELKLSDNPIQQKEIQEWFRKILEYRYGLWSMLQ
jgi:hypothetical protein